MRVLAIEREVLGADKERIRSLLREEAQTVWHLQKSEVLRGIWFTEDQRAVLMLECAGRAAAEEALRQLPLYREQLIDFEICALQPYTGLERLMTAPK